MSAKKLFLLLTAFLSLFFITSKAKAVDKSAEYVANASNVKVKMTFDDKYKNPIDSFLFNGFNSTFNYHTSVEFSIDAKYLKPGNKIGVLQTQFNTNNDSFDVNVLAGNNAFAKGTSIKDKSGKEIGYLKFQPNGKKGEYWFEVTASPSEGSNIGVQTFVVNNGDVTSHNWHTSAKVFKQTGSNPIDGECFIRDYNGNILKHYSVHLTPTKYYVTNSWENQYFQDNSGGHYVRNSYNSGPYHMISSIFYKINKNTPVPSGSDGYEVTDTSKFQIEINNSTNGVYQFGVDWKATADAPFDKEITKPWINGQWNPQGKTKAEQEGDSLTDQYRFYIQLITPKNKFSNEKIDFIGWGDISYFNRYYVYDPISKKSYLNTHMPLIRQKNNLSMNELKAILDKDTNKSQILVSEQENGHLIEAINVTKNWMRNELEMFFEKKNFYNTMDYRSYYWMALNDDQKEKVYQNTKNFYLNIMQGTAEWGFLGGNINFIYRDIPKHITATEVTLNQDGKWKQTYTNHFSTYYNTSVNDGQSGVIVKKVDIGTGELLPTNFDTKVGDKGTNVNINLNDYRESGYQIVTDSNKFANITKYNHSDILTKNQNQVTLPSEGGKWKVVYIAYKQIQAPSKKGSTSFNANLVKGDAVFPNADVDFEIKQKLGYTYDSLEFKDPLDSHLKANKAESYLDLNGTRYNLTDSNVVSSYSDTNNVISVKLDKNFLANKSLIGKALTLHLKTKVDSANNNATINNTGTTVIDGVSQNTNQVTFDKKVPTPIKPVKSVDKTDNLKYGDKLTYTIKMPVPTLGETIGNHYSKFVVEDNLSQDLRIDEVAFLNGNNQDYTKIAGDLNKANNKVTYTATKQFLDAMPMQGETYTLKIDTTYLPKHKVTADDVINNSARVTTDIGQADSNMVTTKVKPTDPVIKKTTTYTGIMDSTKDNRVHYQIKANYGDAHDTTGVGIYDAIPQNGTLDTNSIKVTGDLSQSNFTNHSNGKTLDLKPTTNVYNTNTTVDFDVIYAKDSDWSDFAKYMVNPSGQTSDKSYMQVPNVGELRFTDGFKLTDTAKVNVGVQLPKISEKVTQNNQALTDFLRNGKYSDNNYNAPIKYVITVTPGNYQKLNSVKILSDINHNWLDFGSYLTKYEQANISLNGDTHTADFSNPQSLSGKTFNLEITGKALTNKYHEYAKLGDMIIGHNSAMQINGQSYQSNATKVQLPNIYQARAFASQALVNGDKINYGYYQEFIGLAVNKNNPSVDFQNVNNVLSVDLKGDRVLGTLNRNTNLPTTLRQYETTTLTYSNTFNKMDMLNSTKEVLPVTNFNTEMYTRDNSAVIIGNLGFVQREELSKVGPNLKQTMDSRKINYNDVTLTKDKRNVTVFAGFNNYFDVSSTHNEVRTRLLLENYQLDGYDNAKVKGGYGAKLDHKLYVFGYQLPKVGYNYQNYLTDYKLGFKALDNIFDDTNIDNSKPEFLAVTNKVITDTNAINNKLKEIKNGGSFEKYTDLEGFNSETKDLINRRESQLHLTPQVQLQELDYNFNKRVLDNGHQAYDLRNSIYNENNNKQAVISAVDGDNRNYLKEFVRTGNYRAKIFSTNKFGVGKNVNLDFDINYNVYGHRYLVKSGTADDSAYDEIAVQPVVSGQFAQQVEGFNQSENEWLQNNQ
ncbi:hypothetical protein M5361_13930 [Ligilactobacillus agilis]|nr:hypothetical protein [Ligilactobacillus agilis]